MSSSSHNRNPAGVNQFTGKIPGADDDTLANALRKYHTEGLTSNKIIAQRLSADHGIDMSDSTVKRRRAELGLKGSRLTMKEIDPHVAEQLVLSQLDKDPSKRSGVRTVKARIAFHTGTHLSRDYVSDVMHTHDPTGFELREPTAKKIHRVKKHPIGINHRWAADGHDKLYSIGFPIWGVVDDATAKWLQGWVVPSNRTGNVVAYCFLSLVEELGGIPVVFTTDCGSETTVIYGPVYALRERFHPDIDSEEVPPFKYLRSIHNISIERSWLNLRLDFGDNAVKFFNKGIEDGKYNSSNPAHFELCQWIWPKLLRKELSEFMEFRNGAKMRKDRNQSGPSSDTSISRNTAYSLPELWGGRDLLLRIPAEEMYVIREMKEKLGGEELVSFSTAEFSDHAQTVYDSLGISELTMENVWDVFQSMLPLI